MRWVQLCLYRRKNVEFEVDEMQHTLSMVVDDVQRLPLLNPDNKGRSSRGRSSYHPFFVLFFFNLSVQICAGDQATFRSLDSLRLFALKQRATEISPGQGPSLEQVCCCVTSWA